MKIQVLLFMPDPTLLTAIQQWKNQIKISPGDQLTSGERELKSKLEHIDYGQTVSMRTNYQMGMEDRK